MERERGRGKKEDLTKPVRCCDRKSGSHTQNAGALCARDSQVRNEVG